MPPRSKPIAEAVEVGSVTVWIYPTPSRGRVGWTVVYYSGLKRVRKWFADIEDARACAQDEAERLSNHEVTITGERAAHLVGYEALEMRARGAGTHLQRLVEQAEAALAATTGKDVGELVDEFLSLKAKVVHPRWHEMKTTMLRRFKSAFNEPLAGLNSGLVQQWLDGLKGEDGKALGLRSKVNHRDELRALFNFARRRRYVAPTWDVMAGVELPEAPAGKIQPYSPEEIEQLLQFAADGANKATKWVPYLAVRAFSGVRFEESLRLVGRQIHLPTKFIAMEAAITKTSVRRLVPILPALAAWLRAFPPAPDAPIAPYTTSRVMGDRLVQLIRRAGLQNRHNGLRDAYVSYRMAATQDIARTADESGNSPEMIRQSYREVRLPDGRVITPKIATLYFSTRPPRARDNIIQFKRQPSTHG